MVLLSAFEDFVMRTLGTLSGPLSRLAYLGTLRHNGQYQHWGLSRAYGDAAAGAAISEAHTQIWLEVLRTPLRKLVAESETSATSTVAGWRNQLHVLTPPNLGGGSPRHFHSIVLALSLRAHAAPRKTSETTSPVT